MDTCKTSNLVSQSLSHPGVTGLIDNNFIVNVFLPAVCTGCYEPPSSNIMNHLLSPSSIFLKTKNLINLVIWMKRILCILQIQNAFLFYLQSNANINSSVLFKDAIIMWNIFDFIYFIIWVSWCNTRRNDRHSTWGRILFIKIFWIVIYSTSDTIWT